MSAFEAKICYWIKKSKSDTLLPIEVRADWAQCSECRTENLLLNLTSEGREMQSMQYINNFTVLRILFVSYYFGALQLYLNKTLTLEIF